MINNLLDILTYENIYLMANWGVIPFWLLLIILPNHGVTNFFVQSIIAPLLLAGAYSFVAYNIFLEGYIMKKNIQVILFHDIKAMGQSILSLLTEQKDFDVKLITCKNEIINSITEQNFDIVIFVGSLSLKLGFDIIKIFLSSRKDKASFILNLYFFKLKLVIS